MDQPPRLERCPYDGTPISADPYPGGFVLLSCDNCGASWELHNMLVLRVDEPDWDAVERVRQRTTDGADASTATTSLSPPRG